MTSTAIEHVGIGGGGAWGTALAQVCVRAGRRVTLWAREPEIVAAIKERRENAVFLPGVALDAAIRPTGDLAEIARADGVFLAVPAQFLRAVLWALVPHLGKRAPPLVICAKGIEHGGALMTEVVADEVPGAKLAVLSGPTFAAEVARGQPTAVTLATADADLGAELVAAVGTPTFRPYHSDDPVGAEVGGAVKNVLAIACGAAIGRGLGDNTRAALITRGLAEMTRLAQALGGRRETLMGLSGLGDLVLTCNSRQSRNLSLGIALGEGKTLEQAQAGRVSIAEGVSSAAAVAERAARARVDMPIVAAVDAVLNRGASLDAAINELLARPFRAE